MLARGITQMLRTELDPNSFFSSPAISTQTYVCGMLCQIQVAMTCRKVHNVPGAESQYISVNGVYGCPLVTAHPFSVRRKTTIHRWNAQRLSIPTVYGTSSAEVIKAPFRQIIAAYCRLRLQGYELHGGMNYMDTPVVSLS